jgi:hypothetical protein
MLSRSVAGGAAGFVVNAIVNPHPECEFPNGLPFALQLAQPEHLTASAARSNLQRLVDSHDKPEIDELVVSAGAPDRAGVRFPREEAAAAFFLGLPDCHVDATHMSRVLVHMFSSRQIAEVEVRARDL